MIKNKGRKLAALALSTMLVAAVALTGCGDKGKESTKTEDKSIERLKSKEEVRIAVSSAGDNFDPCMGWGQYGNPLMQSKLMSINSGKIENDLATEYKVSDDGLSWTFKIRDDVKFHDGKKLTAKDIAFTFNKTKSLSSPIDLTNMQEAVAVDDTTVEFKMTAPFSCFLNTTATLGIVPEHAYKDTNEYTKKPIGSGPLKFVQYNDKQQLILERNDDYYGKKMNFKKVVLLNMTSDAAYAALKSGDVDVAITNEAAAQKKLDGFKVVEAETYDYRVISMPSIKEGTAETGEKIGNPVTSDKAIRKALAVGIDRKNLIKNVLYGYGEPIFDTFSKFEWGLGEETKDFKDADIEAAKKILDEAGWIEKNGVREKDGVKAEFTLMYGASDLGRQAIANGFTEEAKKLGIIVKPEGLDWDEIEKRGKTDSCVLGGGVNNPMKIATLYSSKFAKQIGWNNLGVYENSKTDEHIKKAIEATTQEAAYAEWKKALWDGENGGSILGDTSYIPICYVKHLFFVREGLDIVDPGIQAHDHGLAITWNVTNWDYK
ncbi:MAG: ABC transporter substrate-binding protein [Eubacterium sp.]|nr:ABC transporter substrate-binding protein [Eubacterium sp.]